MRLRYFAATLAVLALAGAAAMGDTTGSALRAQVRLTDSAAGVYFAEQLPKRLLFSDHMGTAQVAELSEPLDVAAVDTVTDYRAGDIAYWLDEQTIIVFLTDGTGAPTGGLALLGHISDDLDELANCRRDCPVILDLSLG